MDFMTHISEQLELGVTENGAVGYRSAGTELDTMNFLASSMRKEEKHEILARFRRCLLEDFKSAVIWLFFARDVRQGMGERRLFRTCMKYLASVHPVVARRLVPLIPEYGRWDDLFCLMGTEAEDRVVNFIRIQLCQDIENMHTGKPVSLCAKWMPSENCSSADKRRTASYLRTRLGYSPESYRKMLSALRKHLRVVECDMSSNRWEDINYAAVPSRANLQYGDAFMRHDPERRSEFVQKALYGDEKMNASVLFPHEIVHKYADRRFGAYYKYDVKPELEALWRNLPDVVPPDASTMVVADGSGSMLTCVDRHSGVTALDVANALAIYFAERLHGPYKNRYITFSDSPRYVDLSKADSLLKKVLIAFKHDEVGSTNVEAVFDLVLKTAVDNRLRQEELPRNILIISDMEFNQATWGWGEHKTLFGAIKRKFREHGYSLPRLVFWNVASRSHIVPMQTNPMGVALVSGFSPNVASMVMSGKLDPHEVLMEKLGSKRYDPVRELLE